MKLIVLLAVADLGEGTGGGICYAWYVGMCGTMTSVSINNNNNNRLFTNCSHKTELNG